MRKRDDIQFAAMPARALGGAHDVRERRLRPEHPLDGQSADCDDELGLENCYLAHEPSFAARHLLCVRLSVAAPACLARKAPGYGGHVNAGAERRFVHSQRLLEPTKHRSPCAPLERTAEPPLARTPC